MRNFSQKTVLISGGSSGIGLALSKKLALRNANICILARDLTKLQYAVDEIEKNRHTETQQINFLKADVANRTELEIVISEWMAVSGTPDLVINSAGVAYAGEFSSIPPEIFQWMMDVNYHGTVNVTRIVLPPMIKRKSGHIVNISSLVGYLGMYGYTAYAASKFAVRGFTDSLRTEVKQAGIDLSIVFPPDTDTPQLTEENKHKPPLLFAMDEAAPIVSADYVADAILSGIQKRQYLITPGFSSWLYFRLMGLLGPLLYPVVDLILEDARRKVERDPAHYTYKHKINPD